MEQKISRPVTMMTLLVILAAGILILAANAGTGTAPAGMPFPHAPADNTTAMTGVPASPHAAGSVNISEDQALSLIRKEYPDGMFPLVSMTRTDRYPGKILYECIVTDTRNPDIPSDDENLTILIDAGTGYFYKPGEENAKITIQQAEEAIKKALPGLAADEIRIRFTDFEKQGMLAWEFRLVKDNREFLYGLLDKDTGELRNYHFYPGRSDGEEGSPVTRLQARAIADAEVRRLNGELPVRVIDNQSGRVAGFSGIPDPGSYTFYYERVINTVPCALDHIVVGVNAKTGKVGIYSRRWAVPESAVAASSVPAIAKDAAIAIVEKEARARYPESAGSLRIITADLLWNDEYNEFRTTPAPGSIPLGWNVAFDDATIRAQEYPNRGRAWVDAQNGTLLEFTYIHPLLYATDPGERVIAEYGLDTVSPEIDNTEKHSFLPGDFSSILQPDLEPYVSPKGPVRGMGRKSDGPLTVRMDRNWTLNQTMIDEIYDRIAANAKKYGVDPLPCRFVWENE